MDMVEYALEDVDELIIVIGSAQNSHTLLNPFTAGERYLMITKSVQNINMFNTNTKIMGMSVIIAKPIYIVPVPDNVSNAAWVATIESYVPKFDVVYTNEPLSRRLFKEAGYEIKGHIMRDRAIYSGTNIRDWIIDDIGNWKCLVPYEVVKFIREIDGIGRLKDLTKSDKE
jgi:nicotinamide-nucleotide adenylyltransferase